MLRSKTNQPGEATALLNKKSRHSDTITILNDIPSLTYTTVNGKWLLLRDFKTIYQQLS